MADLSIFKLDSQTINIKDTTARNTANTTASGNATTALNKISELENLSRVTISYDETKQTMTITTGTHGAA